MSAPLSRSGMRVLTVRQPWAQAIASGRKRIEVRSWRTAWRGPLLIHAAARRPRLADICPASTAGALAATKRRRRSEADGWDVWPCGVLVAIVRLRDCRRLEPDDGPALDLPWWPEIWSRHGAQLAAELWAWELDCAAMAVPPLIPLRGRLGLWRPTDAELIALSLARLQEQGEAAG